MKKLSTLFILAVLIPVLTISILENSNHNKNAVLSIDTKKFSFNQKIEDPVVQWTATLGGTGASEILYAVIQTIDSGFAAVGQTRPYSDEDLIYEDIWLVKIDSSGYHEWNTTYGDESPLIATSLLQTSDGGFTIGGSCFHGLLLVKTDSNGQQEWNQTFIDPKWDQGVVGYSMIPTMDGGYAIVGEIDTPEEGIDIWLIKTDTTGQQEWNKTFGGKSRVTLAPDINIVSPNDDYAYSLIQTADKGYALAGRIMYGGIGEFGESDMLFLKINSSGQQEWNITLGGHNSDVCYSIIQTEDNGYVLAGSTDSYGAGGSDMWLVKIDKDGNPEWNTTFGGTGSEECYSLIRTADNGFALAGGTTSWTDDWSDIWLVKTDYNGQSQWNITIDIRDSEDCRSVIQTTDGGFALIGYGANLESEPYNRDGLLVKISAPVELTTIPSSLTTNSKSETVKFEVFLGIIPILLLSLLQKKDRRKN
ncbi:MAG: hypothetical protein ACFFFH_02325 [Candidatus Thorarchaeota archaeon]